MTKKKKMTVRGWRMRAAIAAVLVSPFLIDRETVQAKIVVPPSGSVIEVDTAPSKSLSASSRRPKGRNWRIRGNVGESPRGLPFGTAPHPLF